MGERDESTARQTLLARCPDYDGIKGWLALDEAEHLYSLARALSEGVIVEIGSAIGRSTVALSPGAKDGGNVPVFAIEPHEPFVGVNGGRFGAQHRRQFYETMLKFGGWENVRLVNLASPIVTRDWPHRVGLLWIDGDHRYEGVADDFARWEPHLLPHATVVFDDAADPASGPARVVAEALASDRYVEDPAVGRSGRSGQSASQPQTRQ